MSPDIPLPLSKKLSALESKMPECKTADLILSWESTFFSWIVRKITRSQWSHASVCIDSSEVVSAVPLEGVRISPLWSIANKAVYRVKNLNKLDAELVASFCKAKVGSKYDYVQALLLGYRILTDKLDVNKGDPSEKRFVCSELVAEAFATVGIFFGKIVDNALPATLANSPLVERVG
jgi:hypothetical protein